MKKTLWDKAWVQAVVMAAGTLMMAASFTYFFIPNKIAPGGFSGIGTLLYHQLGLPVGAVSLALNVPLFLLALRKKGLAYILRSLAATIAFSLLLDVVPPYQVTGDDLLATVYGGGLVGIGLGLVVRAGGSTGGTDMLAKLLSDRLPGASFGVVLLAIEAAIVAASGLVFGPQEALYAVLVILLSSKIIDVIQEGLNAAKAFFIVSDRAAEIGPAILMRLRRGVTALSGTGMYTGQVREVLLCVVERAQVLPLQHLIGELDPNAFVIVTDVHETLGKGFEPIPIKKAARAKHERG